MASHHFESHGAYSYIVGLIFEEMELTNDLCEDESDSFEMKSDSGYLVPESDQSGVVDEEDVPTCSQ